MRHICTDFDHVNQQIILVLGINEMFKKFGNCVNNLKIYEIQCVLFGCEPCETVLSLDLTDCSRFNVIYDRISTQNVFIESAAQIRMFIVQFFMPISYDLTTQIWERRTGRHDGRVTDVFLAQTILFYKLRLNCVWGFYFRLKRDSSGVTKGLFLE